MSAGMMGRRGVLGAGTAGALLFGIAGEAKATELDGELLGLVVQLDAVQARIDANEAAACSHREDRLLQDRLDGELVQLQEAFWPIAEQIVTTPARTPEGVQAKARAARTVWLAVRLDPRGSGSTKDKLVFSLFSDVLGEG